MFIINPLAENRSCWCSTVETSVGSKRRRRRTVTIISLRTTLLYEIAQVFNHVSVQGYVLGTFGLWATHGHRRSLVNHQWSWETKGLTIGKSRKRVYYSGSFVNIPTRWLILMWFSSTHEPSRFTFISFLNRTELKAKDLSRHDVKESTIH